MALDDKGGAYSWGEVRNYLLLFIVLTYHFKLIYILFSCVYTIL